MPSIPQRQVEGSLLFPFKSTVTSKVCLLGIHKKVLLLYKAMGEYGQYLPISRKLVDIGSKGVKQYISIHLTPIHLTPIHLNPIHLNPMYIFLAYVYIPYLCPNTHI